MRAIWNGRTPDTLNFSELLTVMAIYHVYKNEGDDYLETTKRRRMPWVLTRDIRGTVTKDVVNGFDLLFQESLGLLQKAWNHDESIRNEIKERIETGDFNPALDFVEDPRMKNAVGLVLLRQIDVRQGIMGPDAFEIAKGKMEPALKEVEQFVGEVIMASSQFFVHEMGRHNMRGMDINAVNVKIVAMDEQGPVVEFNVDEETVYTNDQRAQKESEGKSNDFNPMFG